MKTRKLFLYIDANGEKRIIEGIEIAKDIKVLWQGTPEELHTIEKTDIWDETCFDCEDKKLVFNKHRAKELRKDEWRKKRKKLLEQLDVEFMKALEDEDKERLRNIKQQKKDLRDVTNLDFPNDDLKTISNFEPVILQMSAKKTEKE